MRHLALLVLLLAVVRSYDMPVIAAVTVETSPNHLRFGKHHIPQSYLNWIMMAGARIVPIKYGASEEEIEYILDRVNGVFFPGGAAGPVDMKDSEFFRTLQTVYKIVKHKNDMGINMPIWGICLGFESLMMLSVNDTGLLKEFSANKYLVPSMVEMNCLPSLQ